MHYAHNTDKELAAATFQGAAHLSKSTTYTIVLRLSSLGFSLASDHADLSAVLTSVQC